jgi:hypothetical protein
MAWTRIIALSAASSLWLFSALLRFDLQTRAEAASLEDTRTGITGTSGNDVIDSGQPLDVNTILETTSDEDVTTTATGIDGLAGHDQITDNAAITTRASSRIDAPYVPFRLCGTSSKSYSYGLRGGDASDVLLNLATILSTSTSYTKIVEVIMQIDLGVVAWPTSSTAYATGIEGGNTPDVIENNGTVNVTATSETLVKEARISAVEIPLESSVVTDGKTTAASTAIGITGDLMIGTPSLTPHLAEVLSNRGVLSAVANATSTTEQAMVELVGAARLDDSTTAEAYSAGILGGVNDNLITNYQTIRSEAVSSAHMTSVELKMKGLMLEAAFDLFGIDVGTFETAADSTAVGMGGGPGDDILINKGTGGSGESEVSAKANADSEIYTFSIAPPLGGGGGEKQAAAALTAGGLSLEVRGAWAGVWESVRVTSGEWPGPQAARHAQGVETDPGRVSA